MEQHFIDSLTLLNPQNWTAMANGAKLLRAEYSSLLSISTESVCESAVLDKANDRLILPQTSHLTAAWIFLKLKRDANMIYLGAKAASIEDTPTAPLSTTFLLSNIVGAGLLLENFVTTAQNLVGRDYALHTIKGSEAMVGSKDFAAMTIFDRSQEILEKFKQYPQLFLPKPETVIAVVEDEIGMLPDRFKKVIRDTMQFKPDGP